MIDMRDLLDIPFGNRFIGFWEQEPVRNKKEIIDIIKEHLSIDNIGISISTYKDNNPYLLFLPFDFDCVNLRDAWDDAKRTFNYFVKEGYGTYITFSGRKGFHVFVPTIPKVYTRKHLRVVQNYFKNLLSLKTVDEQIFGDVRRLMRIAGTYNPNGGLCKILSEHDGKEIDLDDYYEFTDYIETYEKRNNGESQYHDYPCIESIIRNDTEPRHLIRFTYVTLRLDEGWSIDEIIDEIESFGWQDFKEGYTRRQIEHIDSRGYVPPSCETLREMGYCTVVNCPYDKNMKNKLREVGII